MIRVVCIEDEPDMIELLRLVLGRLDFEVHGACGGREGLEAVERLSPQLILLDIMLPEMDGWEVYSHLKANPQTHDIPVIIVTARAQAAERLAALREAGVDDYVTKPFGPTELLESVERVLSR